MAKFMCNCLLVNLWHIKFDFNHEQAWGLVPTSNNNTTNPNILNIPNTDGIDPNTIMTKEFEQLQKIWIQTLVASTILQKNNTQ